jgi:hypothetical protein
MDKRGAAPRKTTIREVANILLAVRGSHPPPTVGSNWPDIFINRYPDLRMRASIRHDYQRALNEDPKLLREWFL